MSTSQFLYIAQERGRAAVHKVGHTARTPAQRRPGLRGAANTDFDMVRVFPTANSRLAEQIAHDLLDQQGSRKTPRRELFAGNIDDVARLCEKASQAADKFPACPKPVTVCANAKSRLSIRARFWRIILEMPVVFAGTTYALGELMALSLEDRKAEGRLKALGIVCVAARWDRPVFEFSWHPQARIALWAQQRGQPGILVGNHVVTFQRTEL